MALKSIMKGLLMKNISSTLSRTSVLCIGSTYQNSKFSTSLKTSTTSQSLSKVVFISQSTDIYSNLALEDWLYQNWNFSKKHMLLLWRNSPSVVIGRHQNPYNEANLPYLKSAGVPVVRRNSGGGTVYHDHGNLNCTFFSGRARYNRRKNLQLICEALKTDFEINGEINKKDDIILSGSKKISGTAAKLGRFAAYHHCTLLVNVDKSQLNLALQGDKSLKTKATPSVPSSITNLQELSPNMSVEKLLASVGRQFLETDFESDSGDASSANLQRSDGFTLINPTEDWFPGIEKLRNKLLSWEWFYGMNPQFEITRPVSLDKSLFEGSTVLIKIKVYHDLIKEIHVENQTSAALQDIIENKIGKTILGTRFSHDVFKDIEHKLLMDIDMPKFFSAS